ncbi:hypothetical protein KK116_06185 [Enterobacter dykesii]|uniref:hypothetical protein n=1 Tax=Enterobacter dykesii TaxID=2797506 RepID=UPI001BE119FF|nr:hypothetical protein [Enterobacter dykesii]MBT1713854.1 hypothetical protein [Enterobacter dykesii]
MIVISRLREKHTINHLFTLLFISHLLMLTGCQHSQSNEVRSGSEIPASLSYVPAPVITPKAPAPKIARPELTSSESGAASTCQRELIVLSKVNQRLYAQKKAAFDELISSVSVYTAVREDINPQTKDTMDAFYKFKTQKICSDIEQAVRQALINRVENFK